MRNITLMDAREIASGFYSAFAKGDVETMISFYDDQIVFEDPAFGKLKGDEVKMMWKMLIERSQGTLKIDFKVIEATENTARVNWEARYLISNTGRHIHNKISAELTIEKGKIIKHIDHFNLWKWAHQAIGWKGLVFGWTAAVQSKIRKLSRSLLDAYAQKK